MYLDMKKVIRLTEGDLRRIVKESVDGVLQDYKSAREQTIQKLRKMIPHLPMLSPDERKYIEA